jgi:Arc/MetJ-type ribon-helix-helix transcriptional regulator
VNHLPNIILAVRIPETLKQQIEQFIKKEYPRFKTYSDVIRAALNKFLEGEGSGKM